MSKLRSIFELHTFCRTFVPNFARVAAPLNKGREKGVLKRFEQIDIDQQTVGDLKQKLATPPFCLLQELVGGL